MRRLIVQGVVALLPVVLASSAAVAQDPYDAPVKSASPGGSASATVSATASAAPSNAPILLSPGVSPEPKVAPKKMPVEPADTRSEAKWFGWQTIGTDLLILGGTAAILTSTDEKNHLPVFLAGAGLFLAAGPLIHLANGSGHAGRSLIFRGLSVAVGVPAGALLIGGLAGCTEKTPCKLETVDFMALGTGIGAVIATIVDGSVFAWKSVSMTPNVARVPGGMTFGINAVF